MGDDRRLGVSDGDSGRTPLKERRKEEGLARKIPGLPHSSKKALARPMGSP